ncbi:2-phosphosulfolactate phosphatase [Maribellus sp. CM-23]|uniref:2-phosphosulfolactate phosphatase n=1 Tax=Maribellus sp. CM-23 TaxID=2781026 RepID=UPI001F179365|nr:2-phosphosulfolactate phosphatase [Maribellus sp. CM-23]MCE4563816.1 2-phosphosulfolactate phosphatase [Maribellus sp. CM-23]
MNIQILQLIEGAKVASGITVIIDVFRAFSTACYAVDKGIKKIYPMGDIRQAYQLKEEHPDYLLVGERNEQKPEGFDFGNSPDQLINTPFPACTMIHTTSSGTQGIVNATNAEEILTGSFVNAGAIVRYIRAKNPATVSLVCMGYACEYPTDEDTLCAEFIKNELEGKNNDFAGMIATIKAGDGARFFDPDKQSWSPENDFRLCTQLNRFNFVLKVEKEGELVYLRPIEV